MVDINDVPVDVLVQLGSLGKWIQAVGLLVVIWLVVQGITLYFNRKRRKAILEMKDQVSRIDRKLDKISKKLKI